VGFHNWRRSLMFHGIFYFCAVQGVFIDYQWVCGKFCFPLLPKTCALLLKTCAVLLRVGSEIKFPCIPFCVISFNIYTSYKRVCYRAK